MLMALRFIDFKTSKSLPATEPFGCESNVENRFAPGLLSQSGEVVLHRLLFN
jgi:hypothetical protein